MTLQIKIIIMAFLAASFLALGWTAKHYHDKFVAATAEIAAQQVVINTALAAADICSKNTKALKDASDKKEREVEEAQKIAEEANRKKQSNATSLLTRAPTVPTNLCKSASDLITQYKKDMAGK